VENDEVGAKQLQTSDMKRIGSAAGYSLLEEKRNENIRKEVNITCFK
jgi:hypothetical protein